MRAHPSAGFTLVQTIVTIVIIGIGTTLIVSAFPLARRNQQLISDTHQIQLWLRQQERDAINEKRPEDCLAQTQDDPELKRRCSDLGLAWRDSQIVLFADLTGDREYSPVGDFVMAEHELETTTTATDWQTILFLAVPPTISMIANGQEIAPTGSVTITLQNGSQTKELPIYPYRHVDVESSS